MRVQTYTMHRILTFITIIIFLFIIFRIYADPPKYTNSTSRFLFRKNCTTSGKGFLEVVCLQCAHLTFFVAVVVIAAYLFWVVKSHEYKFEFFDATVLTVVLVAVLGAIGTFYKNAFLLGFIGSILICVGIFFVLFVLVATYFFVFDEARFNKLIPMARGVQAEMTTKEPLKVYMTMVAFCFVHALAFFMIAMFSCKLRSRYR